VIPLDKDYTLLDRIDPFMSGWALV